MQKLDAVSSDILAAIAAADDLDTLDAIRIDALGKKGRVSLMMRDLGGLDAESRKSAGQALNKVKEQISVAIESKQATLADAALNARLKAEAVDVSLPGRPEIEARLHPLSRAIEEVIAIFAEMGFAVAEGPDIESDYYNFTALNIPPEHPARQEHDAHLPRTILGDARSCEPIPRLFKSALWKPQRRRSGLLCLDAPTVLTMMRPIRRCFTNAKG